jgi:molecular chaperone DnaK
MPEDTGKTASPSDTGRSPGSGSAMITIGIDLGTTNTVAAVNGEVTSLSMERSPILPSVVAFPPNRVTLIGSMAARRRAIDPKNTIFSAKRLIGRAWHSVATHEFRTRYAFDLVKTETGGAAFQTRTGVHTPTDIATILLGAVCKQAWPDERELAAVIAVPAEFQKPERDATTAAGQRIGAAKVALLDEPVATALAYQDQAPAGLRRAAVYDLGGGTFDFAILDCAARPFRVVTHLGDLYLGGDDIDLALARWAADRILQEHNWNLRDDPAVFNRLVLECERAKCRLSYALQTEIPLSQIDPAGPIATASLALDQDLLSSLSSDLVRRTFGICDEVLRNAGVKASDLDAVFLAGGSTELPMVKDGIRQYFGKDPVAEIDPMEVVAIGASRALLP